MPTIGIHKIIIFRPQSNASTNRRLSGYGRILGIGITVVQDLHHFEDILNQHFSSYIKAKVTIILPLVEVSNLLKFKDFDSYKSEFSFISYSAKPILPQLPLNKFLNCIWNSNGDPITSTNVLDLLESIAHADESLPKQPYTSWGSISHRKNIRIKEIGLEILSFLKRFKISNCPDTSRILDAIEDISKNCSEKSKATLDTNLDGEMIHFEFEFEFDPLKLSVDKIMQVFNFQSSGYINIKITDKNKFYLKTKLYLTPQDRETQHPGLTLIQVVSDHEATPVLWIKSA